MRVISKQLVARKIMVVGLSLSEGQVKKRNICGIGNDCGGLEERQKKGGFQMERWYNCQMIE